MISWQFLADNLPHATATLNATATILLILGFRFIRRGNVRGHRNMMLSALGVSALFLMLYLLHKAALYQVTGSWNKRFPTDPEVVPTAVRYGYYLILATHLVLAITVPYFALRAVYLAWKGRIVAHKRIVKIAYPVWMYVSVTGVLVYVLLYHHQSIW